MQSHLLADKVSLSKIRRLVRADLVRVGATSSTVFDCLVAVTESCTAALNTRGDKIGRPARVSWTITSDRVEFCIESYNPPPSERNHPRRRFSELLEAESGLSGLHEDVIRSVMDRVAIEDAADSRTLTMSKGLK